MKAYESVKEEVRDMENLLHKYLVRLNEPDEEKPGFREKYLGGRFGGDRELAQSLKKDKSEPLLRQLVDATRQSIEDTITAYLIEHDEQFRDMYILSEDIKFMEHQALKTFEGEDTGVRKDSMLDVYKKAASYLGFMVSDDMKDPEAGVLAYDLSNARRLLEHRVNEYVAQTRSDIKKDVS